MSDLSEMLDKILENVEKLEKDYEEGKFLSIESKLRIKKMYEKRKKLYLEKVKLNKEIFEKIERMKAKKKIDLLNKNFKKEFVFLDEEYRKNKNSLVNNIFSKVVEN